MSNRGADFLLKNRAAFPRLNGELCREAGEMPPDGLLFIDSCGAIKAFDRKFELLAGAPVTRKKVTALFPAGCTPFDLLETCERHQEVRHARVTPPERPGVPARIEYIGVAGGLLTVIRLDGEHEIDDAFDDVAGSAIAILDPQGSLVRFNRGAQELMSLFEEEVLGRPFWDVLPAEEEKSSVRAAFEDLLAGADMPVFENRSKTRGGSVRTLLWSSAITRNATGHIQYVVCTGIDVTLMRGAMRDTRPRSTSYRANSSKRSPPEERMFPSICMTPCRSNWWFSRSRSVNSGMQRRRFLLRIGARRSRWSIVAAVIFA